MKINENVIGITVFVFCVMLVLAGFYIRTLMEEPADCTTLQAQVDSLVIELDNCWARNAKMEKDFKTCYTYKNRAWANNLQSK